MFLFLFFFFFFFSSSRRHTRLVSDWSSDVCSSDLREQVAFTLTDIWRLYTAIGDLAAARKSLDEARSFWREVGNLPMLCETLASSATLSRLTGNRSEERRVGKEWRRQRSRQQRKQR